MNPIRSRSTVGALFIACALPVVSLLAQGPPPTPAPEPALDLKIMTFNIQAGGGARGGGPTLTVAQGAGLADIAQRTMSLERAAADARTALTTASFGANASSATLTARATDLATAELRLADARATAFVAMQAGPGRITPAQVSALAQQGTFTAGAGRGGAGAATTQTSWAQRRDVVFDVLKKYAPDLVGTQESGRLALNEIQTYAPGYGEIGVSRDVNPIGGEYVAVLYRLDRFTVDQAGTFWLSETPEVPGSRSWDSAFLRVVTWARLIEKSSGRGFYYYNTHLDNVSQLARERGVQLMMSRVAARQYKDPVVITGDFNSEEPTGVIQYMKGRAPLTDAGGQQRPIPMPFIDTFRVLHPDQKDVRTRHDWTAERTGEKIDYVFVPSFAETFEADILYDNNNGRYPSDHYPVFARVRLPGGAR